MGRSGYKWISHDFQNEIIDILGKSVVRSVLAKIKSSEQFSIIVDETSDISIHEQVSFCVRTVSDDLIINEDFILAYMRLLIPRHKLFSKSLRTFLRGLIYQLKN